MKGLADITNGVAKTIWLYFIAISDNGNQDVEMSYTEIADATGLGRRAVISAISFLLEKNFIRTVKSLTNSNKYRISVKFFNNHLDIDEQQSDEGASAYKTPTTCKEKVNGASNALADLKIDEASSSMVVTIDEDAGAYKTPPDQHQKDLVNSTGAYKTPTTCKEKVNPVDNCQNPVDNSAFLPAKSKIQQPSKPVLSTLDEGASAYKTLPTCQNQQEINLHYSSLLPTPKEEEKPPHPWVGIYNISNNHAKKREGGVGWGGSLTLRKIESIFGTVVPPKSQFELEAMMADVELIDQFPQEQVTKVIASLSEKLRNGTYKGGRHMTSAVRFVLGGLRQYDKLYGQPVIASTVKGQGIDELLESEVKEAWTLAHSENSEPIYKQLLNRRYKEHGDKVLRILNIDSQAFNAFVGG